MFLSEKTYKILFQYSFLFFEVATVFVKMRADKLASLLRQENDRWELLYITS